MKRNIVHIRKKNLNSKTAGTEIIALSLILKLAENALSPHRSVFSFLEQECEQFCSVHAS